MPFLCSRPQCGAVLTALLLSVAAGPAMSEGFPSKPVEVVVPFAQGGGTDQVGRAFAEYAQPHLGAELFVSNRAGGSGAVGFAYGAQARPDGHVITMTVTTLAAAPHTIDGYPVSYQDFEPVCLISAPPAILAVRSDSAIESLDDLIATAKENPGTLTFGTAGPGSNTHLTGAAFAHQAGIDVKFVPHKGSGPALTSAYGGHIDVAIADKAEVLPWFQDGRLRVLTVFSDNEKSGLDGVPLAASKGFEIDIGSFRGLGAPKGTPPEVLEVLIDACRKTTQDEKFVEYMRKTGTELRPLFGAEFGAWIKKQHDTFGEAAKVVGLAN